MYDYALDGVHYWRKNVYILKCAIQTSLPYSANLPDIDALPFPGGVRWGLLRYTLHNFQKCTVFFSLHMIIFYVRDPRFSVIFK